MKKGITPVIAVVLLLMITIAMVGFAYVWFTKLMGSTTSSVTTESEEQIKKMGQTIRIESAKTGAIIIRNSGTQTIPVGQITIIGTTGTACSVPELIAGNVHTCPSGTTCTPGATITVSAPGNVDSAACTS